MAINKELIMEEIMKKLSMEEIIELYFDLAAIIPIQSDYTAITTNDNPFMTNGEYKVTSTTSGSDV